MGENSLWNRTPQDVSWQPTTVAMRVEHYAHYSDNFFYAKPWSFASIPQAIFYSFIQISLFYLF